MKLHNRLLLELKEKAESYLASVEEQRPELEMKAVLDANYFRELIEVRRWGHMAFINAVMAIEAVINVVGVYKLGEDFYRRNIERLSWDRKFELILALCYRKECEKDEEVLKVIRSIANERNEYLHPKARDFSQERLMERAKGPLEYEDYDVYVDAMEKVYETFASLNPDLEVLLTKDRIRQED